MGEEVNPGDHRPRTDGLCSRTFNKKIQPVAPVPTQTPPPTPAPTAGDVGVTGYGEALIGAWLLRLHRLLTENPGLRLDFERLLRDDLTPLLSAGDRSSVAAITQTAHVRGKSNAATRPSSLDLRD